MNDSGRLQMAMESVPPHNGTHIEAPEYAVESCDQCSSAGTPLAPDDHHLAGVGDSTQLFGVQVVLILAYITIIVFGVVGNALVIYVVYKFKTLRTVTNFFIVNLAVSDLFMNTLCLPFTLVHTLYGEWKFGRVLCFVLPCAQAMAVHVSTITFNIIALDRHRSIVYHLEPKMSKDMCALVIVATWAVSALLASPLAVFREYVTLDLSPGASIEVCAEQWPGSSMDGMMYSICMLLVQYGLPLAVNSFAYLRIWSMLKKHSSSPGGRNDRHRRRRKTTKMLVTVVVVFAVTWLPFHAVQLAIDIDSSVLDLKDFKLLFTVFHIMAMCSTCVNPILYGWMNNSYRNAFRRVCKCDFNYSRSSNTTSRPIQREVAVCSDFKATNV
ncbi:neuropeptide Y receptor type 2 [Gadus chalcogrammus]|uniref:neuropeptide Y receptor type 2 n=1 Tax=Gadus chalcogrammus TaxID=1042646 RepID=UPI0024C3C392|nr:neuropeptide Y receptor type 2 [Gadus chalcogrammus]